MRRALRTLLLATAILLSSAVMAQEGRQKDSIRHARDSAGKGPDSISLPKKKVPGEVMSPKKKNTADTTGRKKKMPPRRKK